MKWHRCFWAVVAVALLGVGPTATTADGPAVKGVPVELVAEQPQFLTHEPILVLARLKEKGFTTLLAGPGESKGKTLSFEITPGVKARKGAKPLPVEAKGEGLPVTVRTYDLLEWYEFPAEGSWTVRLVVGENGKTVKSAPLKITLRRPAKDDKEHGPVDRLHHTPWSNYTTNAFCGDTFDLVKRWPESRLARYAHYYNGVYQQHKKEYAKALESFRAAAKYYPHFLADHADLGIVECLQALGRTAEAAAHREGLLNRLEKRHRGAPSAAQLLAKQPQAQATGAQ
jgi:hypothetical protein